MRSADERVNAVDAHKRSRGRSRGVGWRCTAVLAAGGMAALSSACSLFLLDVDAPLGAPPQGAEPEPPPPDHLLFITFREVVIPNRTRDGRQWDAVGGSAPDPLARLYLGERLLLETPTERETFNPTWPKQREANYLIAPRSRVRVEVWDNNAITDQPICHETVSKLERDANFGETQVRCASGALVVLQVEPARPRWGLGFRYELGDGHAVLTSVFEYSPASRAGLRAGDSIVSIDGKDVAMLDEVEIRSKINAGSRSRLVMKVRPSGGSAKSVTLVEGPVYLTDKEQQALGE